MFGNNRFPLYLPITILLCSCINMVVAEHISESKNKEYFDDNQLLTSGYEDMGIQARNMLHSGDTSAYFKLLNYSFGASLVSCAAVQVNAVYAAPCAAFLLSSLVATVMGLIMQTKSTIWLIRLYTMWMHLKKGTINSSFITVRPRMTVDY